MSEKITLRDGRDRLRYTLLFELILVSLFTGALASVFEREVHDAGGLAVLMSFIAMAVNLVYNYVYDRVDAAAGRIPTERSTLGRVIHAVLFEISLMLAFLPLTMVWLDLDVQQAIIMNAVGMIAVVIYTFVFTWVYDRRFPVPQPSR